MLKISYLILMIFLITHCSIDNKSGLWENKNTIKDEKKLSEINFDKELSFEDFKKNVVLFGKKSNYPTLIKNNE